MWSVSGQKLKTKFLLLFQKKWAVFLCDVAKKKMFANCRVFLSQHHSSFKVILGILIIRLCECEEPGKYVSLKLNGTWWLGFRRKKTWTQICRFSPKDVSPMKQIIIKDLKKIILAKLFSPQRFSSHKHRRENNLNLPQKVDQQKETKHFFTCPSGLPYHWEHNNEYLHIISRYVDKNEGFSLDLGPICEPCAQS